MFKKLLVFTPVLFSVIFFSINLLYLWHTSRYYVAPSFKNAVIACKDVSNDHWADYERTYQDKCIDEFFNGKEDVIITIIEVLWVCGLLLSVIRTAFIIPLSIYSLLSWRKYKYGHY